MLDDFEGGTWYMLASFSAVFYVIGALARAWGLAEVGLLFAFVFAGLGQLTNI